MQNVMIMTDSAAGIPPELADTYHIKVIPAALIHYGGKTYIDNVTLSRPEAYELIKKDPDNFSTSAISPEYIVDEYRELLKETNKIVHITISQELSAVIKTAGIALETIKTEFPDAEIKLINSNTAAGAQGLIVIEAAKASLEGKSIDEISDVTEQARQKTGGIMMWDTIRYVYRTGRMSKTSARLASLFGIKPISCIEDSGTVEMVARVRKRAEGYDKLVEYIRNKAKNNSLRFLVMHSASPDWAEDFSQRLRKEFDCREIIISEYSPVLGYATGPGAIFVGFQS